MKAVVCGYGGFGHAGLAAVLRAGIDVPLVLTHADSGNECCWWESMAGLARTRNVPVVLDADLAVDATRERIAAAKPDLIFSFFFRHLIPTHILAHAPRGAFNLHTSLLPLFRGRAPINWQLVHGVQRTGFTLHRMVERADAGGIVLQEAFAIDPDEDAYALTSRMLTMVPGFLDRALAPIVAGTVVELPQDIRTGSVFGRRTPEDGRIDWTQPARRIHDLVRAVAPPWPGAFTSSGGTRIMIARTRVVAETGALGAPGTCLPSGAIACGTGAIHILCAYAGSQGFSPRPGTILGS